MTQKIVVGPINKGIRTDREPFVIDNDSFPTLLNAYQWRGRVKRKRGTSLLARLTRFFNSANSSYGNISSFNLVGGAGNLLNASGFNLTALSPNATLVPGSVQFTDNNTGNVYTDANKDGTLQGAPAGSGTINYATGAITIVAGAGDTINTATFNYYPILPVMGLEDLILTADEFPGLVAFDTVYSYSISTSSPFTAFDVSFYKNLATGTYPGYVQKTNWTPTTWNGQAYQQFWTTNYQSALWATNGINVPFSVTNIGMQYKVITNVVINAVGPPALATLTVAAHGLVKGDFVFINEVSGITGINFQTGYVVSNDPQAANSFQVEFPNAVLGGAYSSGGIAQYLTNRSDTTKDCLRWYDGAAVNPSGAFSTGPGWANFAPPLQSGPPAFGIADLPPAQYYLIGARMIVPFKDRLLFIGPVVQTSAAGSQVYLQDSVVFSQNGTPYYTASFNGQPAGALTSPTTVFNSLLTPNIQATTTTQQGAAPNAYFLDTPGFGGFIQAGYAQPITTVNSNEDVLIMGFTGRFARFVYSGDDLLPFNFFIINSELGANSTFSSITMDQSSLTIGSRGITATNQISSKRIDLDLPDQVFEFNLQNNGPERITAQRDFINEWIYFTYRSNDVPAATYLYPTQTLQYNYRDESWGIFNETYTTYGNFTPQTGFTWATVGLIFPTWADWNQPWDAGDFTALQQKVIGGNQQGFVLLRDEGTSEATSLIVQGISGNTITCPDHCLRNGDYITFSGMIGSKGQYLNGQVFTVMGAMENSFQLNPTIPSAGTYSGGGLITKLYVPLIQTKQFPVSWQMSRKTRIGPQQYLFTTTAAGQIQLLIFLSQNASSPYNTGNVVPTPGSVNNSLVYSTVLNTCPESTNLGLTPANINLNMLTAPQQAQTWHRMNTSLIGDTVQIGFTLSDAQMRAFTTTLEVSKAITGATQAYPCVLTVNNYFSAGQMVLIQGVLGMTQLNGNVYQIISSTLTTLTINVDSTSFTAYSSGGTATAVGLINQFSEIEFHGMTIDVSPSQMLS